MPEDLKEDNSSMLKKSSKLLKKVSPKYNLIKKKNSVEDDPVINRTKPRAFTIKRKNGVHNDFGSFSKADAGFNSKKNLLKYRKKP